MPRNDLTKNGTAEHLKKHLILYSFRFTISKLAIVFTACSHYPYQHHHTLQLIFHKQSQIHVITVWIFCIFFSETCYLLGLLQMTVFYICICQTGMQMFSSIMNNDPVSSYDIQSLHPWELNIWHLLTLAIYQQEWDLCGLVIWGLIKSCWAQA